jgi:glycosyltransferase involved in cell wall biosynthesis
VEKVYGVTPDAIACPGIDFSAYQGKIGPKKREIITVARLTKFKRIDFLLEVFRELLKDFPDLAYHIVGTGEEEINLQQYAVKLGLSARVVFHGELDTGTLSALYRRSTLFLHGSIEEPFGMAPLEAIAHGTPVVAHKSGGPLEFVTENCGRLVDSLDIADWVREITGYLNFLTTHKEFPEQARECARSFDWQLSLKPAIEVIARLSADFDRNNVHIPLENKPV